ncbi:organ-specific protein P4-like [Gastrolobium bilobum]|uniref:organ-specific protein P4-like n=1 Tax=Gastrolobium bilobum TaxID=150636 RepID=UPI002AAFD233|nr:organ-specific protein P4-like [Gastrolobium bilobum]
MKSISAVIVIFSLVLVANFSYARKDLGDYWKNMMKAQPMPEAIKDLIQDPRISDAGKDPFIRDFDVKPNVILYHTHVVSNKQKQKPFIKNQDGSMMPLKKG